MLDRRSDLKLAVLAQMPMAADRDDILSMVFEIQARRFEEDCRKMKEKFDAPDHHRRSS